MEGVMKQWKEEETEVEEVSLIKRQTHMHVSSTTITTSNSKFDVQGTVQTHGSSDLSGGQEMIQTEENSGANKKKINSIPPLDSVISVDSAFLNSIVRTESEGVGIITEKMKLDKELNLESLYEKQATQGFYCPNCKVCIQKVLLLDTVKEETSAPSQPDTFRCSSCFSFIPIGSWLFPGLEQGQPAPGHSEGKLGDEDGADIASNEDDQKARDSQNLPGEIRGGEHDQDESKTKHSLWGLLVGATPFATKKKVKTNISEPSKQQRQNDDVEIYAGSTEPDVAEESGSSERWEILKSIVYGGLIESIASLGIVTSSASSDATTLNILVLSLANLIGGLFILIHNIWDLKPEQPRTNNETNKRVDRYYHLGNREHFYLHAFIAILSFIIFGLVPPLVYAFTFNESNNKDLKLAAVAGASAICITLLSVAKTYIQRPNTYLNYLQRPNTYLNYLKTVIYYLTIGAMTSVISYLAGEIVKELIEKLGLFDTKSSSFSLLLPEMSLEKPRFGSY